LGRGKWQIEHLVMRPVNWRWFEALAPTARFRAVKKLVPWYRPNELNVYFLPINRDIELGEDTPMPVEVLHELIDRASHRVVVDRCLCRATLDCERYPADIGCLMMGRSALEISPDIRREVSPEEAKEHVRRAVEAGLVPFCGKARVDNFVFGIRNKRQLLSVCFCCECCSISRFARYVPPAARAENLNVLEGIRVEVGDKCNGCGLCVDSCFLRVIQVVNGRAVIGEGCVACGRCATACRRGAVSISLDNPELVGQVCERIERLVDYRS
jgi:UDP-glucose 4-epimerase